MPLVRTGDFDCHYTDDYLGPPWQDPEVVLIQAGFAPTTADPTAEG